MYRKRAENKPWLRGYEPLRDLEAACSNDAAVRAVFGKPDYSELTRKELEAELAKRQPTPMPVPAAPPLAQTLAGRMELAQDLLACGFLTEPRAAAPAKASPDYQARDTYEATHISAASLA